MKTVEKIVIRKDGFYTPSKPWVADVYFKDGNIWVAWSSNYRTKKSLIEHVRAVDANIPIVRSTLDTI